MLIMDKIRLAILIFIYMNHGGNVSPCIQLQYVSHYITYYCAKDGTIHTCHALTLISLCLRRFVFSFTRTILSDSDCFNLECLSVWGKKYFPSISLFKSFQKMCHGISMDVSHVKC